MRRLVKLFCFLLILLLVVGAAEAVYFGWVVQLGNDTRGSDAIVVFRGTNKRFEAGYELAEQGVAGYLVLSPADPGLRERLDEKYGLDEGVVHIAEPRAETTFQNALYASRIISEHDFDTVTLVTSDYHMPRSLALMKLFLAGRGVKVRVYMVAGPDAARMVFFKLVYNEMVEFWGSMAEYAGWKITGELPAEGRPDGALVRFLRALLLMDVKPAW